MRCHEREKDVGKWCETCRKVGAFQSLFELGIIQLTVEMKAVIPLLRATFPCTNET